VRNILLDYLKHIAGDKNVRENLPLSQITTFKIGGPAKFVVDVLSKEILMRLISGLSFLGEKYFILGLGANVLASDDGFNGVIIRIAFKDISHTDDFIYADAGAKLGVVCNFARDNNLAGLEWAVGIPATIGGAAYMNAGAFGGQMSDIIVMADILENGELKTLSANSIKYGYRSSVFQGLDKTVRVATSRQKIVILGVYLKLQRSQKDIIAQKMKDILQRRKTHPKEPSAGSVFKRPFDGFYVGKVLDELGLKGYQIGGAKVSEKHAGFIVNTGGATCKDVLHLMEDIKTRVKNKTGVLLENEIVLL
jgi:UDP-N-acetylmuramate dehydrogenase